MRFKLLLGFEIKNAFKKIPQMLIGAIVLIAIIGTIAFCGNKYLYNTPIEANVKIGLVIEDNSSLMEAITKLVTDTDSIKEFATFVTCDRDELFKLLENSEILAGIILQENAAKDIMNGTNTPIQIIFPKNSGFEAAIISEIASAIASMLSTAQAGVYTSIDYYNENYKYNAKEEMLNRLNMTYITTVLFRERVFNEHLLSATGEVSVALYYTSCAIVMFMLFFGINIATVYSHYSKHLSNKLILNNIGIAKQTFIKYLTVLCMYMILVLIMVPVLIYMLKIQVVIRLILPVILSVICISAMTLLIYELFRKSTVSILFIFLFSVILSFISGCFVPWIMLPDALQNISCVFPAKYIVSTINDAMTGSFNIINIGIIILFSFVYFILAILIKHHRVEKKTED